MKAAKETKVDILFTVPSFVEVSIFVISTQPLLTPALQEWTKIPEYLQTMKSVEAVVSAGIDLVASQHTDYPG